VTSCGQGFLFYPCSNNELRVTSYELRVYGLRVTSYDLVTSYELRVTSTYFQNSAYTEFHMFFFKIPNSIRNWPKLHGIMRNSVLRE
jgi:hypothetical protein